MKNVLVVLGSVRKGRVADKILTYIQNDVAVRENLTMTVADLKEIDMPFFDNELSPSSPGYIPTEKGVLLWSKLVSEADSVLFITPEYNHGLSAVQKNAFDSLYNEWSGKPVAIVAYGWTGGSRSLAVLNELIPQLKAVFTDNPSLLTFKNHINPDGSAIDEALVASTIKATIDAVA